MQLNPSSPFVLSLLCRDPVEADPDHLVDLLGQLGHQNALIQGHERGLSEALLETPPDLLGLVGEGLAVAHVEGVGVAGGEGERLRGHLVAAVQRQVGAAPVANVDRVFFSFCVISKGSYFFL